MRRGPIIITTITTRTTAISLPRHHPSHSPIRRERRPPHIPPRAPSQVAVVVAALAQLTPLLPQPLPHRLAQEVGTTPAVPALPYHRRPGRTDLSYHRMVLVVPGGQPRELRE